VSVVELKISGDRESAIALKIPKSVPEDGAASIEVMVSAGAWTGKFVPVELAGAELAPFLQELGDVIENAEGEAHLETSEGNLDLQVEAGSKGRFSVSGYLCMGDDRQVTLEFSFDTNAAALKPLVGLIQSIEN
jgi:hypothetical protein